MADLFDTFAIGSLELRNRIVMAPMTRSRAYNLIPTESMAVYYGQRATAGLIVSEGTPITPQGRGQVFTPGIYTDDQAEGWKKVTNSVHVKGGAIFMQLWHVGRGSHISHQPDGQDPVSSVSRRIENSTTHILADDGTVEKAQVSTPRALDTAEIPKLTGDFVRAASKAISAGFDGIELHGANGYLFEQFINGELNTRNDKYGGNRENRLRFTLETIDAVAAAIGSKKTAIRLAPFGRLQGMQGFPDEEDTWLTLAAELNSRQIAYVHLSDQASLGAQAIPEGFLRKFRQIYKGTLIIAGGFSKEKAEQYLHEDFADLIAFGQPFIANPDLVDRFKNDWPLAIADRNTYYSGGDEGYIDYLPHRTES